MAECFARLGEEDLQGATILRIGLTGQQACVIESAQRHANDWGGQAQTIGYYAEATPRKRLSPVKEGELRHRYAGVMQRVLAERQPAQASEQIEGELLGRLCCALR